MNLENVQPGDTLIWSSNRERRVTIVDRITKTQVITDHGKYWKLDGKIVGNYWGSSLSVPEPGEIEEIRVELLHRKLVGRVNNACQLHCLRKLSLETLQQLDEVLLQ